MGYFDDDTFNDFRLRAINNYMRDNNDYNLGRRTVRKLDDKIKQDWDNQQRQIITKSLDSQMSQPLTKDSTQFADNPEYNMDTSKFSGLASDYESLQGFNNPQQQMQSYKIQKHRIATDWNAIAAQNMGKGKTMEDVRKFQEWAMQQGYDVGGGGIADGKLGSKTQNLWNRYKNNYLNPNTVWNFGTHKWESSPNTAQKPTQPSTTQDPVQTSPGVQTWQNFVKDTQNLWSPYAVSSMFDAPIFDVESQQPPVQQTSQYKSVPVSTPKQTVKSEAAPTTSPVTTTPQFKFQGDTNYPNEINMNNAVRAQYSDFLKKNNLTEQQYPYSQALQIAKNNYLSGKYMLDKNKNKTRVAFFSPSFIRKDVYTE